MRKRRPSALRVPCALRRLNQASRGHPQIAERVVYKATPWSYKVFMNAASLLQNYHENSTV